MIDITTVIKLKKILPEQSSEEDKNGYARQEIRRSGERSRRSVSLRS
jgi:hypothetical protein